MKFHAQVRTLDGAVTSYVRVRAETWGEAEERARVLAARRSVKSAKSHGERYLARPDPDGWQVIYLSLHKSEWGKSSR